MKKITDFLEKNVQWLAIGLGGLYLLWMVYSFVLTNTAWQIPVGDQVKSPGEVDQAVEQIADQLKKQIDSGPKIRIAVPDFKDVIDLNSKKRPDYALAWANSPTQDVKLPEVPLDPNAPKIATDPKAPPAAAGKIVELPKAPPATDLAVVTGRSNVMVPPPPVVVNANDPNAAPPAVQAVASASDIDWITVTYKISLADLAREFQRTQMPPQVQGTTTLLDVELYRQEKQANGNWGEPTLVPKLTLATQPPGGVPADNAGRGVLSAYLAWAVAAMPEIVQPRFYDVVKGDPWTLPKELIGTGMVGASGAPMILGPNDVREGFDANSFAGQTDPKLRKQQMDAMNPPLTMREKQLISKASAEAKTKAANEAAKSRAPTGPRGGGGPGGGGGGAGRGGGRGGDMSYAPDDGYRPPGRPQGRPGGYDEMEGGYSTPMQAQQGNFAQMFPLPQQGDFDPRQIITANAANAGGPPQNNLTTLVGWAHDAKPEPGKTYKYMIRYKIKNPIWATGGFAKDKALAEKFAIVSMDSGWTKEIQAKPIVQFFFATGGGNTSKASIDVYRHQDGTLHRERFTVSPGDAIGMEKNSVDFVTGFTLVDLRPEIKGDRVTAWLISPEGTLVKKDVKSDVESTVKQELDKEIQAAAAPTAVGAAGGNPAGGP